jgi:hypothetical protein
MTLVADNRLETENVSSNELNSALLRWRYSSPSVMLHHGKPCCSIAREWLFSTDHSQLSGQNQLTGPRWLRRKYDWGPSQWPMTWCYAVEQDSLDCGALAAMSRAVFDARGVLCHSVQLIQQYSEDTTSHWSAKWVDHPASTHWIQGRLIYHEACAIALSGNEVRIWDPSAGWWVNPKQFGGYGSIVAMRVLTEHPVADSFVWGANVIAGNKWEIIQGDPRPRNSDRPRVHSPEPLIEPAISAMLTKVDLQPAEEV